MLILRPRSGSTDYHFIEFTEENVGLLAEGGRRRQAWRIFTMATSLLVHSGSAVLPLEYTFINPLTGAAWAMDRFIPSSRQPQHWSRNYHGLPKIQASFRKNNANMAKILQLFIAIWSRERRRSKDRRKESPDSQEKDSSSYSQGVTLRAEDLLVDSEFKMGTGSRMLPANHLASNPGDTRRAMVGGSATELAQNHRGRAGPPVRRSSEGGYNRRRRSSSSSSNAADDPTSSDPSSSFTTSSTSSFSSTSSESGCNADSETCNYCRLSESTEGRESSTEDDRSLSPTPPRSDRNRRRLTRALSEECNPPSRPIRRTSPGEYLRHKRDQMEKLRSEKSRDLPPRNRRPSFQRCDSDPRLSRRHRDAASPSRTLTFVSPTRNRVRKTYRKKSDTEEVPSDRNVTQLDTPAEVEKPRRSALAKNLAERHSTSKERRSSMVWSADESTPFIQRRASFRCAVCDCDIPFTNCVLCNAEAKGAYIPEGSASEVFINENDLINLNAEDYVIEGECIPKTAELRLEVAQEETKELEEFYDRPTPVEFPSLPMVQPSPVVDKRTMWTSKASIHKSFNQEEYRQKSARRSSLRKYNSEPVPETEDFHYSREQSEASTPSSQQSQKGIQAPEQTVDSSASNSSKSESRAGYHVAKDSPQKEVPQQKEKKSSCRHVCGKTSEEEDNFDASKSRSVTPETITEEKNQRSPSYLKPHFDFEPEILHKANPLVDEAEVDVHPGAVGAFRRLSEEEFISTLNIHDAAKKGDLHVVKLLTKKDPKQMETVDERGWTPIHLAAAQGHAEVVRYLALEGAHLAALDPSSYTALHLAAMNGHNPILEVLLPLGVDVDSVTAEGFTALHLAVMNTHLECIQTLLQWGASLDKKDALGRGIHDMIEEYNLQDVASLLRRFHKQLHNFKHMLDMMNREGRSSSDIPREYMDILASIAEESGTE